MPLSNMKRFALVLLAAAIVSLAIFRVNSISNVPFCHYSAGCVPDATPEGKITQQNYGYPLAYRSVQTFNPINNNERAPNYAGYAETKIINESFSLPSIIINIIFWFSLLWLLSDIVRHKHFTKTRSTEPDRPDIAKDDELR